MTIRYSTRKPEQAPVTLIVNGLVGQGTLLNLSVPGCLIETRVPLSKGHFVHLRIQFGAYQMRVPLAAVRWVKGRQAGIEFIRMSEDNQARLRWHVGHVDKRQNTKWKEAIVCSGFAGV